jgi:hypothetical protein
MSAEKKSSNRFSSANVHFLDQGIHHYQSFGFKQPLNTKVFFGGL